MEKLAKSVRIADSHARREMVMLIKNIDTGEKINLMCDDLNGNDLTENFEIYFEIYQDNDTGDFIATTQTIEKINKHIEKTNNNNNKFLMKYDNLY